MTWHLVTSDFPPLPGGISTWARGVAMALHDAGEAVEVHARARILDAQPAWPFPVHPIYGRSWARWQGLWSALAVYPRVRPGDVVLAATWPLAVHLVGRGFPVGVAYHGSDLTRPPTCPGLDVVKAQATAHLPVSRFLGGLLGVPFQRLPVPISLEKPAERGEKLLVVARLGPLKGVDQALRLAQRLGRPITIVGDGPERLNLEALAISLGVSATFTGTLPPGDLPWDGTWALCLFSRAARDGSGAEGLGLVLLEAAARGIPTLGSCVGGVPEAATVVLADVSTSAIPALPEVATLQRWLSEKHGADRCLEILRSSLAPRLNQL